MKKTVLFFLLCLTTCVTASNDLFIVKSPDKTLQKHSANTLKEMLGESARDLFKYSIELHKELGKFQISLASHDSVSVLHKELGKWQVEIACLQSQCSEVLEKLLENQKPFKKATKKELQDAYQSMQAAHGIMQTLKANLTKELDLYDGKKILARDKMCDKTLIVLQSCVSQAKSIQTSFNAHVCLRVT